MSSGARLGLGRLIGGATSAGRALLLAAGLVLWLSPADAAEVGRKIPEGVFPPGPPQVEYEGEGFVHCAAGTQCIPISLGVGQLLALLPQNGPVFVQFGGLVFSQDENELSFEFFEGNENQKIARINLVAGGFAFIYFPTPPLVFGTRFSTSVTLLGVDQSFIIETFRFSEVMPKIEMFLAEEILGEDLLEELQPLKLEFVSEMGTENTQMAREGFLGMENQMGADVFMLRSTTEDANFAVDDTRFDFTPLSVPIPELARLLIYAGILVLAASSRVRPRRLFGV